MDSAFLAEHARMLRVAFRPWLAACCCAGVLVLAGCGHGGAKHSAPPAWVQRANSLCKVDDRKIAHAEKIAGSVVFTAATVSGMMAELDGLARLGLVGRIPRSFAASQQAMHLLLTSGDYQTVRTADRLLLGAKRDAAKVGVRCSFGAVPLSELQ
jgi:hypothetical protein